MPNQHLIMPITRQQILQTFSSPWLPKSANVIILALFSWWAVVNVLQLFDEKEIIIEPKNVVKITRVPAKTSLQNINLFGTPETAEPRSNKEAKPTKLNLTLRGILATNDPSQGIAQIQNASKEEKHFAVNDTVFGVATLDEIHIDRVILLHNGRYETLLLPEEFLNVKHFSAEKQRLERKRIATDYRKLFLDRDGERLEKLFGFDTAWKNGGFAGFIVKALSDEGREMMAKFGVEDGDLITVVNGLRFSESLQAAQQLTELKNATSVDIIVERDGEEFPIHIEFDTAIKDVVDISGANPQANNPGNLDVNIQQQDSSTDTYGGNTTPTTGSNYNNSTTNNSSSQPANTSNKSSTPSIPFDERPKAEEFKRMQRERATGNNAPVEYDH